MDLQSLFEQLNNEISNKLYQIKQLEVRERSISDYEVVIRSKNKQLAEKMLELNRKITELEQEKEFVTRKLAELQKKEDIAQSLLKQGEEITKQKEEFNLQKKALGAREFILKDDQEKLRQDKLDLERREALVTKQVVIDQDRKASLDRQEESNRKERERLQNIAMQYK